MPLKFKHTLHKQITHKTHTAHTAVFLNLCSFFSLFWIKVLDYIRKCCSISDHWNGRNLWICTKIVKKFLIRGQIWFFLRWDQFGSSSGIINHYRVQISGGLIYLMMVLQQGHNGYYGNIFFFFVGFKFKGVVEKFLYRWNCFIKQGHFWDFTLEDHYKQFSIKNGRNGCRFAKSGIDKELWFVSKGWNFGEGHYGHFTSWNGLHKKNSDQGAVFD